MADGTGDLLLSLQPGDGVCRVVAAGEVDLATSPQLRATLLSPEAAAASVVLDLRDVSFMDSSGLGVIVGQQKRARTEDFEFSVVVRAGSEVERLMELSRLVEVVDVRRDAARV